MEQIGLVCSLALAVSVIAFRVGGWLERERWIRALDSRLKWLHVRKVTFTDFPFAVIDLIYDAQQTPWNKALLDGEDCFLPQYRFDRGTDVST
jgi:hypothetical protein